MAGATRVFCTKLTGIFPRMLLDAIKREEPLVQLLDSELDMDFESPTWGKLRMVRTSGRTPIEIDHHVSGLTGTAVEEESIRFMTIIETLDESWGKREVTVYLRLSREMFVISCEGEPDDHAQVIIGKCAKILAGYGEGMVQVDGVGFYKKGELILPLPID